MGIETAIEKDYIRKLVIKHIDIPNIQKDVEEFLEENYVFILLKDDGFLGYTEDEDTIYWWYLYSSNKIENTRKALKIAKKLKKTILYAGKKDFYHNNSSYLGEGVYQLMI